MNRNDINKDSQIKGLMLPLMLVLFMSTLDQTIVVTALSNIGALLGNATTTPWIATAYLLTSAVTTLIFGKLGDMYGRKKVLQLSIVIFLTGSILCAFAPSMLLLIIFRGFQGIGGGALSTLVMAIVGELVPSRGRAKYQATLGLVPAIALLAGPVLGGLIVDYLSWPWIFLINVPVGIIAFSIIALKLQLPVLNSNKRVDISGGLLAIVFTTSFLLISVFGGHAYNWDSWQTIGLGLVGIFALRLYIYVEQRAVEPITPLRLFKDPVFSISSALFLLSTAMLFVGMLFIPQMLQNIFHLSAFAAGSCIVPLLFGLIVATMVTGHVISKTGRYKLFPIIGSLFCTFTFLALGYLSQTTAIWLIIILLIILGGGVGLFIQVTLLAGQNTVTQSDLGAATGTLNFFKNFGGAAGAAVFGAIFATASKHHNHFITAYHSVFLSAIPLAIVALLLAIIMKEKALSETTREIAEGKIEVPEY